MAAAVPMGVLLLQALAEAVVGVGRILARQGLVGQVLPGKSALPSKSATRRRLRAHTTS